MFLVVIYFNLLNGKMQCIECKSRNLIKDLEHRELYCGKCGLVLIDSRIITLQELENKMREELEYNQSRNEYNKLKNFLHYYQ